MIHLQKIVFEGQVYTDNDAYSVRFSVVFKKVFAQIFHQCIKEKELQQQYEEETERSTEIDDLETYMKSSQYIEDVAKSKLGLTYKNEIIFKEKK